MSCHSWNANLSSRAKFFWGELLEMHIFIVLLQDGFRSPFWNQRNFKLKKFAILKKFDGTWHKRAITSSLLIQCILYILHCHYENSQLPDYFPREINGQYKEECRLGWHHSCVKRENWTWHQLARLENCIWTQKILSQIVNKVKIETLPELIIGRISQFSPASQWLLTTLNIIKSWLNPAGCKDPRVPKSWKDEWESGR